MAQPATRRGENAALLVAAVAAVAALLCWRFAGESSLLFPALRWITLAALVVYGCFRRTLTAWIFIAMLLGAEIGHDFPNIATNLRVLALIFLRLIKTIIAPLLFATLVVGIAGHSNLAASWAPRAALHHLLRDRHHHRALSRPRRHQLEQGGRWGATTCRSCYRNHSAH